MDSSVIKNDKCIDLLLVYLTLKILLLLELNDFFFLARQNYIKPFMSHMKCYRT